MPYYLFVCPPEQCAAGCIERCVFFSPQTQPMHATVQTEQGPRNVMLTPDQYAWRLLQQEAANRGWIFAPNATYKAMPVDRPMSRATPICVQMSIPADSRVQVNAPDNQPVGNTRQLTMPPLLQPKGAPRTVPSGMYEELNNCALVSNADSLLGEMDGQAGTFTDVDAMTNTETVRQMVVPASPRMPGR